MLNTPTIDRVARGEKGLRWYKDMVTKPICDMVMEKVDKEKVAVTKALGLDAWTALKWVKESYGVTGNSLYEVLSTNPHVAGFSAPSDFWASRPFPPWCRLLGRWRRWGSRTRLP
ncbi:MAG: NAD/NADP octopine/nopaline dehydrogenase family protein [Chloroflexi bacterium]|nr:NAD/NADP octopine/nopaline dehydrogenase family protein [Chloroflexota bacterium]